MIGIRAIHAPLRISSSGRLPHLGSHGGEPMGMNQNSCLPNYFGLKGLHTSSHLRCQGGGEALGGSAPPPKAEGVVDGPFLIVHWGAPHPCAHP